MKNYKVFLSLIISIFSQNHLQASLANDLNRLVVALDTLGNELEKPPVPPRDYEVGYKLVKVPGFPLPLPEREEQVSTKIISEQDPILEIQRRAQEIQKRRSLNLSPQKTTYQQQITRPSLRRTQSTKFTESPVQQQSELEQRLAKRRSLMGEKK